MLSDFSREKGTSTAFTPNGVYDGVIRRVDLDAKSVWVELPRIAEGFQFGPLVATTIQMPLVGDKVACMFMEDRVDDIIVLGVKLDGGSPTYLVPVSCTSTTLPDNPKIGQIAWAEDTGQFLLYDGTWLTFNDLLDSIYVNASGDVMNGPLDIAPDVKILRLSADADSALVGMGTDSDSLRVSGGIQDGVNEGGNAIFYGNSHGTFPATVRLMSNGTERLRINATGVSATGPVTASSTVTAQGIIESVVGYRSAGAAASAVAYGFTADPNTGVFSDAADTLKLATGGTTRLTISSAGAVTIPGALNVQDTATFSGTNFARFTGTGVSSTAATLNRVDAGVASGAPRIVLETTGTPLASGGAAVWNIDNFLGTLRFFSNAAERFNLTELALTTTGSINLVAGGTVQGTRLISTVATGTAPLTVTSTTVVPNLNADLLDGVDSSVLARCSSAQTIVAGSATSGNHSTGGVSTGTINFGVTFGSAPIVVACCSALTGNTTTTCNVTSIGTTSFNYRTAIAGTSASTVTIYWMAFGN